MNEPKTHRTTPKRADDVSEGDTIPVQYNGAKLYVRVTAVKRGALHVDVYGFVQVFNPADGTLKPLKVKR